MKAPAALCVILAVVIGPASSANGSAASTHRVVSTASAPITLRGVGARVVSVRIASNSPLVVTAAHSGESNFIVHLVGPTEDYVFNEIGAYKGQALVARPRAGRYRVAVDADGPWTLTLFQPAPSSSAIRIPGVVKGTGARVIQVRALTGLRPVVTLRHSGSSNFIVHLVGIGATRGTREYVANEIGPYRGQTLLGSLRAGNYLLAVDADGSWSVNFTR